MRLLHCLSDQLLGIPCVCGPLLLGEVVCLTSCSPLFWLLLRTKEGLGVLCRALLYCFTKLSTAIHTYHTSQHLTCPTEGCCWLGNHSYKEQKCVCYHREDVKIKLGIGIGFGIKQIKNFKKPDSGFQTTNDWSLGVSHYQILNTNIHLCLFLILSRLWRRTVWE